MSCLPCAIQMCFRRKCHRYADLPAVTRPRQTDEFDTAIVFAFWSFGMPLAIRCAEYRLCRTVPTTWSAPGRCARAYGKGSCPACRGSACYSPFAIAAEGQSLVSLKIHKLLTPAKSIRHAVRVRQACKRMCILQKPHKGTLLSFWTCPCWSSS